MRLILRGPIGVLVLLAVGCSAASSPTGSPVIPAAAAAEAFHEAHELCAAEGGRLWGQSLCGPMLFVDPASRQAVLNGPSPGAVADGAIFRLTLPVDMGTANTAVELEGKRWSMVLWPLPADTTARHILLMHESFHRIQPDLHLPGGGGLVANAHLDTRDGRVWLRGELDALEAALDSVGEVRRRNLADALLLRSYRRSLWPDAEAEERALELNEGLAEWTGIAAALGDQEQRVKAELGDIASCQGTPSFVRSFAYATGPAYAELLEGVQPEWRRQVDDDFDLGSAAGAAYRVETHEPIPSAAAGALARHHGETIEAEEDAREQRIVARNERYTALFVDGPTVTFPIESMQISFNPREVEAFEDRGSVYRTLELHDTWGTLKVASGAALIPPSFTEVIVPAAADTAAGHLAGDGWSATLADGFTLAPDPQRPSSFRVGKGSRF